MSLIGNMLAHGLKGYAEDMKVRSERLQKKAAEKRETALFDYRKEQDKLNRKDTQDAAKNRREFDTEQNRLDRANDLELAGLKKTPQNADTTAIQTLKARALAGGLKEGTPPYQQFMIDGGTKASKTPTTGWNNKSVTDYFTKEAYRELGIEVDQFGLPIEGSSSDHNKARQWISVAIDRWRGMQGSEDPGEIIAEVFNDSYHNNDDNTDVLQQARDAIAQGASEDAIKQRLQEMGINPSLL